MGLSKSKTTTTSGPSEFAKPYITAGANAASDAFNANKGPLADIASTVQGTIPNLASRLNAGSGLDQAKGYVSNLLSQNPQSNPFLQQMLDKTAGDVTDRVQSSIGTRGLTGGSAHEQILARELANSENALRYQDYTTQQGRQDSAVGMAQGLAGADSSINNGNLAALLQAAQSGSDLPFSASDHYTQQIAQLLGNSTTTTQKQSGGLGQMLLQAAASGAGAYAASDPRLKTNIERIGQFDDGLGVYQFDYIPMMGAIAAYMAEGRQTGVMADEVASLRPWALGPEIDGYATVDYLKLGG